MKKRLRMAWVMAAVALVWLATAPAMAEGWWPVWMTVIRPDSGEVLGWFKADAGANRNTWRAGDLQKFPNMRALASANPVEPGAFTDAERKKAGKVALPTFYNGKVTVPHLLRKTPQGGWLVFLEYQNDRRSAEGKWEGVLGKFVVCDPKSGQVRREIRDEFRMKAAAGSVIYDPNVANWQRWWMAQKGANIVSRDVDSDEPLFESSSVFADVRDLDGGWIAGGPMYLNTNQGLKRINPDGGKTEWITPKVGKRVLWVTLARDNLLYVKSLYEPVVYEQELRSAAQDRYSDKKLGYVTFVPVGNDLYGLTWFATIPRDGSEPTFDQCAVWQRGVKVWDWKFDYNKTVDSGQTLDALYVKKGFTAELRSRLETTPP
ncbi:MAG: hypothetical protein FJX76_14640 [Armatimonadetes bacterium]|nr:hypothetical protein [Armatimonadota bacterium]